MSVQIPIRARDGSVRAHTVVDAADADWLNQWTWRLGTRGYAVRGEKIGGQFRLISMHRELLGLSFADGLEVDHISRDKLDNRRSNLRVLSHQGNTQNRPSTRGSSSMYRGVNWDKQHGKWLARIGIDGRQRNLGLFTSEIEAAEVAREARARLMPYAID